MNVTWKTPFLIQSKLFNLGIDEGFTLIGNISKPSSIRCRPACKVQDNKNQMTSVLYPQVGNFFYKKRFCHVASHIWQTTCQDQKRKHFLDMKQPKLCETLQMFDDYFGIATSCRKWPKEFLDKYGSPNKTLEKELFQYGKENLAFVRLMIQNPYVTKIKRDVKMSFTNYVASTGGLLGLCLGFSFISGRV